MRPARPDDLDALVAIAAECFPASPRWGPAGGFARRWWSAALASRAALAGVFDAGGDVLGFTVLVVDEEEWARERAARCGRGRDYARAALRHPLRFAADLRRRLFLRLAARRAAPAGADSRLDARADSRLDARADSRLDAPCAELARAHPGPRTWVELTGVRRRARRRGVARALHEWYCAETLALGRTRIERSVDPANAAMRALCEARGYVHTGQTRAGCIYTQDLRAVPPGARPQSEEPPTGDGA